MDLAQQDKPQDQGQSQQYQLVVGTSDTLDDTLSFRAIMALVDNFTNQYIRMPDGNTFVPPFVQRYPVSFGSATSRARYSEGATQDTPPGVTASATVAGQTAFITFYEKVQTTSAVSQQISVVANTSVDGTLINVASTARQATSTTATNTQLVVAATGLRLIGWTIKENAGASAEVILYNGTASTGVIVMDRTILANESFTDFMDVDGINMALGIFMQRISGNTVVTLYTKAVA